MVIFQTMVDAVAIKTQAGTGWFTQPVATAIIGLLGAIIGGGVTIWYKRKEFKSLNAQLDEVIRKNKEDFQVELSQMRELWNTYRLNVSKFEHDRLETVFAFVKGTEGEKSQMMKEYAAFLIPFVPYTPSDIFDQYEYDMMVGTHIYQNLDRIEKELSGLILKYPGQYFELQDEIKSIIDESTKIRIHVHSQFEYSKREDKIVDEFIDPLVKLHDRLFELLESMKSEFQTIEKMRKKIIEDKSKNP